MDCRFSADDSFRHTTVNPRVISNPLTGSALATAAVGRTAPRDWYELLPTDRDGWNLRLDDVRTSIAPGWLEALAPAIAATDAAARRLQSVANGKGVVVT